MSITFGPQPLSHETRWELAEEIASQLRGYYKDQLIALGVYGSLARGSDGPYSDIEMHCIVQGYEIETSFEWSSGPWKAEVDVYTQDVILKDAAFVDDDWPITHGAYAMVKPIFDPEDFFGKLRQVVLKQPASVFKERMEEVIVGDIYEVIGKLQNAATLHSPAAMPLYAVKLATHAVCLQGLYQRHLYTTSLIMLNEALNLPDHPDGYEALVKLIISGKLQDPDRILNVTGYYWSGLVAWARDHELNIQSSLAELLEKKEI